VVRERRPDSGPGLVVPALAPYTERVRTAARESTPYTDLIARVRSGPPMLLRPFDGAMNTVEYFIHAEDIRRAQEGWEPRSLSPELTEALWARVGARGMTKKVPATIEVSAPGRTAKVSGSGPRLVVEGDPGELIMFGAGRQSAARVNVTGDADLVTQLRAASLGV
jgi:uncharacterized protein (TIGR03085 family)